MRHVQFLAGMIFVLLLLLAAGLGPNPASTVRADAGTWASTGPHERIYALAIDPANNQIVYATGESGLWETRDGGISWMKLSDSQLTRLVIDPGAVHTLYAVSRDGHTILKSTNGGSEWQVVYQGSLSIATIALDPNRPTHIYAGGGDLISLPMGGGSEGLAQLLASPDGGKTWTQILPPSLQGMPENANSVTQLVLLPGLPGVLIINVAFHKSWGGPGGQNPANPGVLALSRDAGASWSSIGTHWDQRTGGSPRGTFLDALAVGGHAIDHLTFYAGYGLTRSDDGGQTWINLQPLLPGSQHMTTLLMDPRQTDWITIGILEADGTVRLYTSIDRGEQWIDIGTLDRPRRLMGWQSLAFAPTTRTFYAATDNGVYQSRLLWPIASAFQPSYAAHDGVRLLGAAISPQRRVNGYASQYFEKGRIEDHQGETNDPNWRFMYGLLVDELQQAKANEPIGGDTSTLSYADLNVLANPSKRVAPPAGYPGSGTFPVTGAVFAPFTTNLSGGPGHYVLGGFWDYINRKDLFPGGWLHDIGLPIMEPQVVVVTKNFPSGPVQRTIIVQAFQRTILTYDPANPPDWQIERANVGSDYQQVFPERVGP